MCQLANNHDHHLTDEDRAVMRLIVRDMAVITCGILLVLLGYYLTTR